METATSQFSISSMGMERRRLDLRNGVSRNVDVLISEMECGNGNRIGLILKASTRTESVPLPVLRCLRRILQHFDDWFRGWRWTTAVTAKTTPYILKIFVVAQTPNSVTEMLTFSVEWFVWRGDEVIQLIIKRKNQLIIVKMKELGWVVCVGGWGACGGKSD